MQLFRVVLLLLVPYVVLGVESNEYVEEYSNEVGDIGDSEEHEEYTSEEDYVGVNSAFTNTSNDDFVCFIRFALANFANDKIEATRVLSVDHDNQSCSSTRIVSPSSFTNEISCEGTTTVSVRAYNVAVGIQGFQIECSASFPLDFRVDKELTTLTMEDLFWQPDGRYSVSFSGSPRRLNSQSWPAFGNQPLSFSKNYTFYAVSNPGLSLTVDIFLTPNETYPSGEASSGLHLYVDRSDRTWDEVYIICEHLWETETSVPYMAAGGGQNPTETRLIQKCLESKKPDCTQHIYIGVFDHLLEALKLDIRPEHGVSYCSDGQNAASLEYFSPVAKHDFLDNMSLIWEDENVIHLQKDDGVDKFFVQHFTDSTKMAPGFTKFFESEYSTFVCHYLDYFLDRRVAWFVRYINGTDKFLFYEKHSTREEKQYKFFNRLVNSSLYVKSSHAKIQGEIGMSSVECRGLSESVYPEFNLTKSVHAVPLGSLLELKCQAAAGIPEPTYFWMFNSSTGLTSNATDVGSIFYVISTLTENSKKVSLLSIQTFGNTMVGEYVCVAGNFRGNASHTFDVILSTESRSVIVWLYFGISLGVAVLFGIILIAVARKFYLQKGRLTSLEIQLFEAGDEKMINSENFGHENAQFIPYNRDYEIKWDDFMIFDDVKLGEGQYGIVFKGCLVGNTGQEIAVKTAKAGAGKDVVFALLSELKVMIHLESHENVVKLLGSCTEFLKDGRVYVLIEYCQLGSLEAYLRQADKNTFVKTDLISSTAREVEDNYMTYTSMDNLSSSDLALWAIQIARGMQHLQSKKVIHADLATRNVLLYSKGQVKITDFGLSRQLMKYDNYVKQSEKKLPWRWLALETLESHSFTLKSDVWSYGVALWEIFSLGLVPYAGMRWNADFMTYLQQDLRLPQPRFATDDIYKIMVRCWDAEPKNRPDFHELEGLLVNLTHNTSDAAC